MLVILVKNIDIEKRLWLKGSKKKGWNFSVIEIILTNVWLEILSLSSM